MTSLLVACGRALYGDRWQSPLARDLGVADRTMRRWVAGSYPVPDGIAADLFKLVQERRKDLGGLVKHLRAELAAFGQGGRPT